ncbi:MAG: hypothetical protein U5K33_01955, partial [Halofilum sp. (in: g-proteobacteria)]|nr:hypothetical protein [Halofilum sp. (in: g-proteobacteria)]
MSLLGRYYNDLLRFVPLIEAMILYASVYIGAWLRLADGTAVAADAEHAVIWPEAALFTGVLVLSMTAMGLYNKRLRERLEGIIIRLLLAFAVGTAVLTGLFYLFTDMFLGRGVLALALLSGFAGIVIVRALLGRLLQESQNLRRIVVLGTGSKAAAIMGLRRRTDLIGLRVVGFIPVNGETADIPEDRKLRIEGGLADWAAEQGVDEIVVAPDERRQTLDMHALMSCRAQGIAVTDLNTFLERETGCLQLSCMTPGWFAFSNGLNSPLVSDRVKRLFDVGV